MDPALQETNLKINSALEHLQKELSSIRAGKAHPSLLEDIPVMAYGARMKLMEVGTITAPQPSLLTIQVWDASIMHDVQKAIMESGLGLNPSVDGNLVRVPIPPLSEERRVEFVKLAKLKGEECRIEIRQIRQDQREEWNKEKEDGIIGEDELDRCEKLLQTLIEQSTANVDSFVKIKEEELMQV